MNIVKSENKSLEWVARNESPILRDVSKEDFGTAIVLICKSIGIKPNNIPQGGVLTMLYSFVSSSLGSYTLKEIILAFNLYCSLKLDFQEEHFQDLNNMFISKLMRSYTRYLYTINADLSKDNDNVVSGEEVNKLLDYTYFIDTIISDVKNQECSSININPLYKILLSTGFIKESFKERSLIFNETRKYYILNIKPIKDKKEKDNFKQFVSYENIKSGIHYNRVVKLLKEKLYKNFVINNKNNNLEELKEKLTKNLNEFTEKKGKSIFN